MNAPAQQHSGNRNDAGTTSTTVPISPRPPRLHAVGVTGMGLGPLAVYLARSGWRVSGEDDALEKAAPELRARLVEAGVQLGPLPEDCERVVISSAISKTHPTSVAAQARGLPIVRRGELLAEVAQGKRLVAVCGSHGKTTTTALLAHALQNSGFGAGYILGGLPAQRSFPWAQVAEPSPADLASWLVAEIDESDGTIAHFAPEVTLCVNLDWDHVDHYSSEAALHATFGGLFARTRRAVLVNAACATSQKLAAQWATCPVFRFGAEGEFTSKVSETHTGALTLALGGHFEIAEARLRATGRFNALNATAALAAAQLMGAPLAPELLANWGGVHRRQTLLSDLGGLRVIEDYAHHPTEIAALLAALRETSGELTVCYQPHRYSRTAQFKRELAAALSAADRVFLLDVYGAGEREVAGGTTADLLREFPEGKATYCGSDDALFAAVDAVDFRAGATLGFVGAGDIDAKARVWVARWRERFWQRFAEEARSHVSPETKLTREEPLSRKTTMLVGGAARVYAEPRSVAELQALLRLAHAQRVSVFPLGRGSNVIVPDEGVEGLVVSLAAPEWAKFEPLADGRIHVLAGLRLKNLCGLAAKAGIAGFEFLEGIPGSVGGALRMNAGAMGAWIFDRVEEVEYMTLAGELVRVPASALHVGYRHCAELAEGAIALGAVLRVPEPNDATPALASADAGCAAQAEPSPESVARQIDVYRKKRVESQPREPSAGCIFKNPPGDSAGRLIDAAGLKGLRVGGAEVSTVHANFIVNRDHATAGDVLALVAQVRARVQAAHGVTLEPEARLFGKDWEASSTLFIGDSSARKEAAND